MREPVFNPGGLGFLITMIGLCLLMVFWRDLYDALFAVIGYGATVLFAAVWLFFVKLAWTDHDTIETREAFIGLRQRWRRFSGSGQQILPPEQAPEQPPFEERLVGRATDSRPE